MNRIYDILTIDPIPAMTLSRVEFVGTYKEAKAFAHASFEKTQRATSVCDQHGSFFWYRIDSNGVATDRNI